MKFERVSIAGKKMNQELRLEIVVKVKVQVKVELGVVDAWGEADSVVGVWGRREGGS